LNQWHGNNPWKIPEEYEELHEVLKCFPYQFAHDK